MIQLAAAGVLLLGAYQAWEQLAQQRALGQRTLEAGERAEAMARDRILIERLADATARLSRSGEYERVSGIEILGRLADSAPDEAAGVSRLLCAFVRQRTRWTPDSQHRPPLGSPRVHIARGMLPEPHRPPPDVEAAVDILRSREWPVVIDLSFSDLRSADLSGLQAPGGRFERAHLERAFLDGADLRSAYLNEAHLGEASLSRADLSGAELLDAVLDGADLEKAKLHHATVWGASFRGAVLRWTDMSRLHADSDTDFTDAHMFEVDISGAYMFRVNGLEAEMLKDALTDDRTGIDRSLREEVKRLQAQD